MNLIIAIESDSAVQGVKDQLTKHGIWVSGSATTVEGRTLLSLSPYSRPCPLNVIASFSGVHDIIAPRSPHPLVDAQNNKCIEQLMLIAGPCSIESTKQIERIAKQVKDSGGTVLRGGAFKPRTSPYSFQGLGETGLKAMRAAADENKLQVVTEVVSEQDVDLVTSYADFLQIGSRNMQNYALLKAVGRVGKPVILKRGSGASLYEWLMAAEHLLAGGSKEVIFCERGIRALETKTRYTLDLGTVAVLKYEYQQRVIVDPSHAVGRSDLVAPMSRAAMALGADGLMLEVHDFPQDALSDGPQAIHPNELKTILEPWA